MLHFGGVSQKTGLRASVFILQMDWTKKSLLDDPSEGTSMAIGYNQIPIQLVFVVIFVKLQKITQSGVYLSRVHNFDGIQWLQPLEIP